MMVVRHKVAMISGLLSSTSTTAVSGMAGLPDENLIELLLHLKVCTRMPSPISALNTVLLR